MSEPIDEIASSRYAARLVAARPELAAELADPAAFSRDEMAHALAGAQHDDEAGLKRRFRQLRQRVLLRVMARALAGRADLAEVCGTMSDLAELALQVALEHANAALRAEFGTPRSPAGDVQQLVIVGMGKLGGRELNVSSDVDLVLVYPEEGETDGCAAISNHEFFVRVARKLTALLSEFTEDGYVFRVDLRLRPYGESGPLVASFEMLETYLI